MTPEYDEHIIKASRDISYALKYKRARAAELKEEVYQLERDIRSIEDAVLAGSYWRLEGILEEKTIERLSEWEPVDRRELLNEII